MSTEAPKVTCETWQGKWVPVYPNGRRVFMEREVIRVTDIRQTPLGPIDFGHVRLMPVREVIVEPEAV